MIIRVTISIYLILFTIGCATNTHENRVRFGLNSCFLLKSGEKVIVADKEVEMFYNEYASIVGVSAAFNRVVRSQNNEYIFITLITNRKIEDFPSAFSADTSIGNLSTSKGKLVIGNVEEYCVAISSKKDYWNYNFVFLDKNIGQPFMITFTAKNKQEIQDYFNSIELIKKRLNCEAPSE